jgi:hypothetical protein
MLVMMAREGARKGIKLRLRSGALSRRGLCTWVERAVGLVAGRADAGIVVNTDNALIDMPAGKESTANCNSSIGIMKDMDGE